MGVSIWCFGEMDDSTLKKLLAHKPNNQKLNIMQIHEIEVVIDKNGHVQVHVLGVKGENCLELTKDLEKALGGDVSSRELTVEAIEQVEIQTPNQIRQHI
jgi:hypothetical protein